VIASIATAGGTNGSSRSSNSSTVTPTIRIATELPAGASLAVMQRCTGAYTAAVSSATPRSGASLAPVQAVLCAFSGENLPLEEHCAVAGAAISALLQLINSDYGDANSSSSDADSSSEHSDTAAAAATAADNSTVTASTVTDTGSASDNGDDEDIESPSVATERLKDALLALTGCVENCRHEALSLHVESIMTALEGTTAQLKELLAHATAEAKSSSSGSSSSSSTELKAARSLCQEARAAAAECARAVLQRAGSSWLVVKSASTHTTTAAAAGGAPAAAAATAAVHRFLTTTVPALGCPLLLGDAVAAVKSVCSSDSRTGSSSSSSSSDAAAASNAALEALLIGSTERIGQALTAASQYSKSKAAELCEAACLLATAAGTSLTPHADKLGEPLAAAVRSRKGDLVWLSDCFRATAALATAVIPRAAATTAASSSTTSLQSFAAVAAAAVAAAAAANSAAAAAQAAVNRAWPLQLALCACEAVQFEWGSSSALTSSSGLVALSAADDTAEDALAPMAYEAECALDALLQSGLLQAHIAAEQQQLLQQQQQQQEQQEEAVAVVAVTASAAEVSLLQQLKQIVQLFPVRAEAGVMYEDDAPVLCKGAELIGTIAALKG
jgi:trimeric autotransporter adhesin